MAFLTLQPDMLQRWEASAKAAGIEERRYSFTAKRVESPNGKDSFGVIWNSEREQRPKSTAKPKEPAEETKESEKPPCPLCITLDQIAGDPVRNMVSQDDLPGWVVIPNLYPATPGHTLAIDSEIGDDHMPMYDTSDLEGVAEKMGQLFVFADRTGFRVKHNGPDAGASITGHEHYHLTNFTIVYEVVGARYGFDDAELVDTKVPEVKIMPHFPFEHLIFNQDEPDRLVAFLKSLQTAIGYTYKNRVVPHGIIQGENKRGILVVPTKNCLSDGLPGIGSGDMAGHIAVGTREDYEAADYNWCAERLAQRLYVKGERNLIALL